MSWFLIAILAQFILGTAAVFDKLLLKKSYPNPVGYTFWIGVLGLFSVVLLPFGFESVSTVILLRALLSGALFIFGLLFFYSALHRGEASGVVVAIEGLVPVSTLVFSFFLLTQGLAGYELVSFLLLVTGAILLSFTERKEFRLRSAALIIASAVLLGLSNVIAKQVFNETNFITGFFWLKVGGMAVAVFFLLYAPWRALIFTQKKEKRLVHPVAYIANRAYAGAGSALVFYAVSLGIPSLVDALRASKFVFIALAGWLLLKEYFRGRILVLKISALFVITMGVVLLGLGDYLSRTVPDPNRPITWGITFSQKYAEDLGVNSSGDSAKNFGWQENYDAIIDDLGAKDLRLIAYWDIIEPEEGVYDFSGLDYQMRRAEEMGAEVILVVGRKVPRWPECHIPLWAENISRESQNTYIVEFTKRVVERYKDSPALRFWQVENEPFLAFGEGECALSGKDLLDTEIALVKQLDPDTPVLITDSGEIGPWFRAAKRGDVFGTTMYRRVYNRFFGQFEYPIGPAFFRVKEKIARFLIGDFEKKFIVIELGMEPWLSGGLNYKTPEEQFEVFDIAFFKDSIRFAKDTGFDEYYLWGAEWWYWMKEKHDHPEFWEEAQRVLDESK